MVPIYNNTTTYNYYVHLELKQSPEYGFVSVKLPGTLGSKPDRGYYVVFLGKALYSLKASPLPGV